MKKIKIEEHVDKMVMPENLKIGLMVSQQRQKCKGKMCPCDYHGFAFGQSPFPVPEPIKNALSENADKSHYSAAEGIEELRIAVSEFNKRHFDLDVDPSRIIIGPGTKDLIHSIFDVIKGGAIIPSPSWIGYSPQIKLLEKHFHTIYMKKQFDYKIQPSDLESYAKINKKDQHILVINNPHNPTGVLYSKKELEEITKVCRKYNILVLADEIYALTTYDINEFTSMGNVYPEGTFITNGLSKDRSAGGYRLGTLILPQDCTENLKESFKKVAATVYTNVSTPTQYAAITAYQPNEEIEEYFKITRQIHRIMGNYVSEKFDQIDGIFATKPQGGFYFYVDFNQLSSDLQKNNINTSNELGNALLEHPYHIATVTGDSVHLKPDDYGARIAFVDYDGRSVFENYKKNIPKTPHEEVEFVKQNAPRMINGINAMENFVKNLKIILKN